MRRNWTPLALIVTAAACAGSPTPDGGAAGVEPPPSLMTLPTATNATATVGASIEESSTDEQAAGGFSLVVADAEGRVGVARADGTVTQVRDDGWRRTVSLDGTYVVSTALVGPGDTSVAWDALPSAEVLGGTVLVGEELEAAATEVGGHRTAFVNMSKPTHKGAIAAGRSSTTIVVASPERGEEARYTLDGNIVPEAFGKTLRPDGAPASMFMLEYLPAEAPTSYRVRVLDTATGELSLPANLRDKLGPRVDQEMAGVTRGQVLSSDHGLLFTLYRGTSDMPDGHPYAFVHTLDLYDGVWCLDIPPEMELEHLPGSLATSGDRLYVASANGVVGSYDIDDLLSPDGPAEIEWVARVLPQGGEQAPAIAAGPDGVLVTWPWMSGFHTVGPDGTPGQSIIGPAGTQALAIADGGARIAVGDVWWDLGPAERPDWLAEVTRLVVASEP